MNEIIFVLILFLQLLFGINSKDINIVSFENSSLVPPQPSQYTTLIQLNGISGIYYADTTIYKDRLDYPNQNYTAIIDFKNFRQYVISKGSCSWSQIPGKITAMLAFASYTFNGNLTHNNTLCYNWNGCHNYEIPPAPFNYYATVKGNIPVDLILPTIDVSIHFSNFTYGPPPSTLFDIPNNCTNAQFNSQYHPIFSRLLKMKNSGLGILC